MKIFVLNQGSSSFKCTFYSYEKEEMSVLWKAQIDRSDAVKKTVITLKDQRGIRKLEVKEESIDRALEYFLSLLIKGGIESLDPLNQVDVIGHRIVHGGDFFRDSVVITSEVKEKIRSLARLAPLHNPLEVWGIDLLEKFFPSTLQVAVFDTAFHHSLPKPVQLYPVPYQWFQEGIRRYGFHGISYQYCLRRTSAVLKKEIKLLKIVICHLGAGASLCAIKDGKSIDTTMGFTPLDGLMMDTRSGSIDPGILLYFLERGEKTVGEISRELYRESGLLGVSGASSNMEEIILKSQEGDSRCLLAFETYLHRLNGSIGSMIASLQGLDVIVFTGGIGENAALLRKKVCDNFSFLGIEIDGKKNQEILGKDCVLSSSDSKVKILSIHTQEELEIARECVEKISRI